MPTPEETLKRFRDTVFTLTELLKTLDEKIATEELQLQNVNNLMQQTDASATIFSAEISDNFLFNLRKEATTDRNKFLAERQPLHAALNRAIVQMNTHVLKMEQRGFEIPVYEPPIRELPEPTMDEDGDVEILPTIPEAVSDTIVEADVSRVSDKEAQGFLDYFEKSPSPVVLSSSTSFEDSDEDSPEPFVAPPPRRRNRTKPPPAVVPERAIRRRFEDQSGRLMFPQGQQGDNSVIPVGAILGVTADNITQQQIDIFNNRIFLGRRYSVWQAAFEESRGSMSRAMMGFDLSFETLDPGQWRADLTDLEERISDVLAARRGPPRVSEETMFREPSPVPVEPAEPDTFTNEDLMAMGDFDIPEDVMDPEARSRMERRLRQEQIEEIEREFSIREVEQRRENRMREEALQEDDVVIVEPPIVGTGEARLNAAVNALRLQGFQDDPIVLSSDDEPAIEPTGQTNKVTQLEMDELRCPDEEEVNMIVRWLRDNRDRYSAALRQSASGNLLIPNSNVEQMLRRHFLCLLSDPRYATFWARRLQEEFGLEGAQREFKDDSVVIDSTVNRMGVDRSAARIVDLQRQEEKADEEKRTPGEEKIQVEDLTGDTDSGEDGDEDGDEDSDGSDDSGGPPWSLGPFDNTVQTYWVTYTIDLRMPGAPHARLRWYHMLIRTDDRRNVRRDLIRTVARMTFRGLLRTDVSGAKKIHAWCMSRGLNNCLEMRSVRPGTRIGHRGTLGMLMNGGHFLQTVNVETPNQKCVVYALMDHVSRNQCTDRTHAELLEQLGDKHAYTIQDIVQWRDYYCRTMSLTFTHISGLQVHFLRSPEKQKLHLRCSFGNNHLYLVPTMNESYWNPYPDMQVTDDGEAIMANDFEEQTVYTNLSIQGLMTDTMTLFDVLIDDVLIINNEFMGFRHPHGHYIMTMGDDWDQREACVRRLSMMKDIEWSGQSWVSLAVYVLRHVIGEPEKGKYNPQSLTWMTKNQPIPMIFGKGGEDAVMSIDRTRAYPSELEHAKNIGVPCVMDCVKMYCGEDIMLGYYLVEKFSLFGWSIAAQVWCSDAVNMLLRIGVINRRHILEYMLCETSAIEKGFFGGLLKHEKRLTNTLIGLFNSRKRTRRFHFVSTDPEDIEFFSEEMQLDALGFEQMVVNDTPVFYVHYEERRPVWENHYHIWNHVVSMNNAHMLEMLLLMHRNYDIRGVRTDCIYFQDDPSVVSYDNQWTYVKLVESRPGWHIANTDVVPINDPKEREPHRHEFKIWNYDNIGVTDSVVVQGGGGSGKTTLLLDDYFVTEGTKVIVCFTWAGIDNLRKKARGKKIHVRTISSFLGKNATTWRAVDTLFLEEYGMCPVKFLAMFHAYKLKYGCQIRCYGDNNQCSAIDNYYYDYLKTDLLKILVNHNRVNLQYIPGCNRFCDDGTLEILTEFLRTGILPQRLTSRSRRTAVPNTDANIVYYNATARAINNRYPFCVGKKVLIVIPTKYQSKLRQFAHEGIINNHIGKLEEMGDAEWKVDGVWIPIEFIQKSNAVTVFKYQGQKILCNYTIWDMERLSFNEMYTALTRCRSYKQIYFRTVPATDYVFQRRVNELRFVDRLVAEEKVRELDVAVRSHVKNVLFEERENFYQVGAFQFRFNEESKERQLQLAYLKHASLLEKQLGYRVITKTYYDMCPNAPCWVNIPNNIRHDAIEIVGIDGIVWFYRLACAQLCEGITVHLSKIVPASLVRQRRDLYSVMTPTMMTRYAPTECLHEVLDTRCFLLCHVRIPNTMEERASVCRRLVPAVVARAKSKHVALNEPLILDASAEGEFIDLQFLWPSEMFNRLTHQIEFWTEVAGDVDCVDMDQYGLNKLWRMAGSYDDEKVPSAMVNMDMDEMEHTADVYIATCLKNQKVSMLSSNRRTRTKAKDITAFGRRRPFKTPVIPEAVAVQDLKRTFCIQCKVWHDHLQGWYRDNKFRCHMKMDWMNCSPSDVLG